MIAPRLLHQKTESDRGRRFLAMIAMILVAFFWTVVETLAHFIPKEYSPVQTVWSRYLVHMIFMLIVFGPQQGVGLVRTNCLGKQISRSMLMVGMPVCFVIGISLIPLRDVWTLSWTSSIMLIFMAVLILKERVSARLWIITLVAYLGVWLMSGADIPNLRWGILAPLGMGFCYALYKIMTRTMRAENSHANLFHTALWVFCLLTVFMPFSWKPPTISIIAIYIGIGFFGYLTLAFLDKSLELAPAALTAPLIYTQPIWVDLFDFMINRRIPELHTVVGATIIIAAMTCLFTLEMTGTRQLVTFEY